MSTDTERHTRGSQYSEEDIERGLNALVLLGSANKASAETDIPPETLRYWRRKTHTERYNAARARLLPRIQAKMAEDAEDLALRYADMEHQLLDRLNPDDLWPAEIAQALPRITTSRAISTDKSLLLHGQPTVITESRTASDILDSLERKIPAAFIDGTAEDVTDAEVEEPALTPRVARSLPTST